MPVCKDEIFELVSEVGKNHIRDSPGRSGHHDASVRGQFYLAHAGVARLKDAEIEISSAGRKKLR